MVKRPEILVIIPARGDSKGLPGKNILDLAGHPLIAYSVAAAQRSEMVTRTIVSTDSEEIADVARRYGAETPFLRPEELAEDATPDLPVFQHALFWLSENQDYRPDIVVQLRPTSPIRPSTVVDDTVRLLLSSPGADSVRAVVPSGQNPYKMWRIDTESGFMVPLLEVDGITEPYNAPRQKLPLTYWQVGIIDAFRPETTIERDLMSGSVVLPIILEAAYAVDIDTVESLRRAERLVRSGELDMVYPGRRYRPMPEEIALVVFDFDGVLTDNRVWVDEKGIEHIAAYRSDSIGVNRLREAGIEAMVLSTETNPVVAARCRKMNLPMMQGIEDKASALKKYLRDEGIDPLNVVFVGNDINDVPCFPFVGCAVVVADAQPDARIEADIVLSRCGGHGAVRELCDMILDRKQMDE